jgi:hypothetical protein
MDNNEKKSLKYFKWLMGAFGTSYLAREAWIWAHMKKLKNEIVKKNHINKSRYSSLEELLELVKKWQK